jgi:hypothetical protein
MLFSWENVQGWPPLQRSSCSNGRILAEFLQDSGRMRPKSHTEEKQSRNDQIKIQRVASICRLPFSTLKTTGTKLLKMLQSLQCKKVTQGYARHKWQRRKKANKQFRQKDYILLYSFIICHALCIFMTLWASVGQDCRDLLLGTWLQVGYIMLHICKAREYPRSRCQIQQDSQIVSGLQSKLYSTALLSAEPTAAGNPQSQTP